MKPITRTLIAVAVLAAGPFAAAHAQNASNAERQALVENFIQADTNNDGMLFRSEFEALMKLNAKDNLGKSAVVVRTGAYAQVFKRLDLNGDGAISREEIQKLAEERG